MRRRSWIVAVALLGLVGCGPPRQTSLHVIDAGGVVDSLAFAPDGRTLACALRDRILLVDAESGTRIRELGALPNQHRVDTSGVLRAGEVRPLGASLSVAFSRGRLLSAGADGYARLWDVDRGVEIARFESGAVGALAISPDGRWLVTRPLQLLRGMPDGGSAVVDNPAVDTITIWDLDHYRRSPAISCSPDHVEALAISVDGLVAAGRDSMTIDVFDAPSAKLVRTLRGDRPYYERLTALAFRPDEPRVLAVGDSHGRIRVWDVAQGRLVTDLWAQIGTWFGPEAGISALSFASDGLLAAGGTRGAAELWRVGESPGREPRALAKLADHSTLARDNDPNLWVDAMVLAMNRSGSLVATGGEKVRIWRGPGPR